MSFLAKKFSIIIVGQRDNGSPLESTSCYTTESSLFGVVKHISIPTFIEYRMGLLFNFVLVSSLE